MAKPTCTVFRCRELGDRVIPGLVLCPEHLSAVARATAIAKADAVHPVTRRPFDPIAEPVVYYAAFPGRQDVKIGTTTNLGSRVRALGPGVRILVAEPGHYYLEKKRHEQFAHLALGQRELFRWAADLAEHIEHLREAVRWVSYPTPSGIREPVLERKQARGWTAGPARASS